MHLARREFLTLAASSFLSLPRTFARLDGVRDAAILKVIIGIREEKKLPGLTAAIRSKCSQHVSEVLFRRGVSP